MSDEDIVKDVEEKVEVLFEQDLDESSEEPPMEEWSSLIIKVPELNPKKILYSEGLYDPGSGEICLKYIPQSDSTVLRHPYYRYPAVTDPGIMKAILEPEDLIIYDDNGQDLYLAICKEMGICPVRIFHRNMINDEINMKYYAVNPDGVRAMTLALKNNTYVRKLDFTDNFLNDDSCYHLGRLFRNNKTLTCLDLSGCRIGETGLLRLLAGLKFNECLIDLNLSRNKLGDSSMAHLAQSMELGMPVQYLNLSYNGIGANGIEHFTAALEFHNKLKSLDVSWNNLYVQYATAKLCKALAEIPCFAVLNLSWNYMTGVRIANAISTLILANTLTHLDLSFNRFDSECVPVLIENFGKAKKLNTFNLSDNILSPEDAMLVLRKMRFNTVKIKNLYLDNILVRPDFVKQRESILNMKLRKGCTIITHGKVIVPHPPADIDYRDVVLKRIDYLGFKSKKKKNKIDIPLVLLKMAKEGPAIISVKQLQANIKNLKIPLDKDLIEELCNAFPGPKNPKIKFIDMLLMADYIKRKWPDRKLPPTPPPEPVKAEEPQGKGKDKGKDKGNDKGTDKGKDKGKPKGKK